MIIKPDAHKKSDYFTNTTTHPSRDARIRLAEEVSRMDGIQYTLDQVNNWFANRRSSLGRDAFDRGVLVAQGLSRSLLRPIVVL